MITSEVDPPVKLVGEYKPSPLQSNWLPVTAYLGTGGYTKVSFPHDLRKLGEGDQGGPFLLENTRYTLTNLGHRETTRYRGQVAPWVYDTPMSLNAPSDASILASGTKAIAATTPTTAEFDAATFLGETLTDGVPAMAGYRSWQAQTLRARNAGDEYLNVKFGWLPLISDIRSFAHAVNNSSDIIANYRDGANKSIRRRFEFPKSTSSKVREDVYFIRDAANVGTGQTLTRWFQTRTQRTWFSGAFKYYLPVGDDAGARFSRYKSYAQKLLGLRVTPETVWNVAPWSWAIDWKTDIGSVVHNYSQLGHDGLVLQYGYVMSETVTSSASQSKYGLHSVDISHKVRIPATPYGFGVDMSALSSQQVSILVALGLSHGR